MLRVELILRQSPGEHSKSKLRARCTLCLLRGIQTASQDLGASQEAQILRLLRVCPLLAVQLGIPSAGLELLAWLHSCPGFSLMCSNSIPAAAPSPARHTCTSPHFPPTLSKTSQNTRHHLALITLRGKQEGSREREMKCSLVSLQSRFPCCTVHVWHGGTQRNIDWLLGGYFCSCAGQI